jgi:hypothetical protein
MTKPGRTLLSAAHAFIRGSAGAATLVIAPLAVVSLPTTAKAQIVFSVPTSSSGGTVPSGDFTQTSFTASALPTYNGITGVIEAQSANLLFSSGGSGTARFYFGNGSVTGTLLTGTTIPVGYDFTISDTTGTFSALLWNVTMDIDGHSQTIASGSGFGTFSGTGDYVLPSDLSNTFYELELNVPITGASFDAQVNVDMTGLGNGIAINVPEPSTDAGILGLCAFGFVLLRRFRRFFARA